MSDDQIPNPNAAASSPQPGPQPGWGAQPPPGQPGVPPGPPPAAATGLDPKVGALLSYLLFGWVGGLIMYFTQKHPEVRFHAAQSILVFGGLSVLGVVLTIFSSILAFSSFTLSTLVGLVQLAINLAAFVLWIVLCIKAYNLEHVKLPVVGAMAEQWAMK